MCAGERSFFPSQIKKAKVNEGPVSYLRNAEEGVGRWGGGDEWVLEAIPVWETKVTGLSPGVIHFLPAREAAVGATFRCIKRRTLAAAWTQVHRHHVTNTYPPADGAAKRVSSSVVWDNGCLQIRGTNNFFFFTSC